MSNLTSLTCPNCGGKLARSQQAGILVCLYCGVEQYAADVPAVEEARPLLRSALSVGLPNGQAVVLIARGTPLPTEVIQSFSTTTDNQSKLDITLVLGEHHLTQDNVHLGMFTIDNITPAPRGVPALDMSMRIDEHEQLTVTVTEVAVSRTQELGCVDLSAY